MSTNRIMTITRQRWRTNMHHLGKERMMMDMLLLLSKASIISRMRQPMVSKTNSITHSNKDN